MSTVSNLAGEPTWIFFWADQYQIWYLFDVIIRKKLFRNTPDMIESGLFRNNDTTSKKVSGGLKNLACEKKCKNKVCRY